MRTRTVTCTLTYLENEDVEREIEIEATVASGERARLYGAPENCHPGSDDEVEWVALSLIYPSGTGIERNLTDADAARLMNIDESTLAIYIRDAALTVAGDNPDEGDDGDAAYDAWKDDRADRARDEWKEFRAERERDGDGE